MIKLTAVKIARIMCDDAVANKLAMIPLSNDAIKWHIQELSDHVLQQTIASMKCSGKFSVQLDTTTHIGNNAQLTVFAQYLNTNDYVE